MIIDNKNFTTFILKLLKNVCLQNTDLICSYIQEINKQNFDSLLNSICKQNNFFLWNLPFKNYSLISFGNIFSYNSQKEFANSIDSKSKKTLKHFHNLSSLESIKFPLFIGGIKFPVKSKNNLWKNFPNEIWYVPEISALKQNNKYYIAFNFLFDKLNPESLLHNFENKLNQILASTEKSDINEILLPNKFNTSNNIDYTSEIFPFEDEVSHWKRIVSSAIEKISNKELEKVVLARIKKIELKKPTSILEIITKLEKEYPECYIFAWKNYDSIFFGASPEVLAIIENNILETDALAGSIKRGISNEEDERLANELLNDKKNINEHNAVLNYILSNFEDISEKIIYNNKPSIKKLRNIQHLWTPIRIKLKRNYSIDTLIKKIYPTPAICGLPKEAALQLIDELEAFDRGLYAGVIGWFNLEGNAEFAIGIRSALIHKSTLYAFAGCGIVAGSNFENEFDETELKLKPILSLFGLSKKI